MDDVGGGAVESRAEADVESAEAAFGRRQRTVPIVTVIHHATHSLPVILRKREREREKERERERERERVSRLDPRQRVEITLGSARKHASLHAVSQR